MLFGAIGTVISYTVLNQDETPLLYNLVYGEGVVNDATSAVLFSSIQSFDLTHLNHEAAFHFLGNFLYLFLLSTVLGVATGLISAYVIKKLYFGRLNSVLLPRVKHIDTDSPARSGLHF